jgi:hypothetical protein
MICVVGGCDEPPIRSQTYGRPPEPRVYLCAVHWMMADDDPVTLRKLLGSSDEAPTRHQLSRSRADRADIRASVGFPPPHTGRRHT